MSQLLIQPLPSPSAFPAALGHLLVGPRHMERRFARHGEVVPDWAPGPGRIVWLRDPQHIAHVLRSPGVETSAMGRCIGRAVGASTLLLQLNGEQHRAVRRVFAASVRGQALGRCRNSIAVAAREMAASCPDGVPFPLLPLLDRAVLQANIASCVSIDDPGELRVWSDAVQRVRRKAANPLAASHAVGFPLPYPPARWARQKLSGLIRGEIARRHRAGVPGDDTLGQMLASKEEIMTQDVVIDQVTLYLIGGQSASLAAAWAVERALRHPDAWAKVSAEGASQDGNPTPYTDAVINEALRLRPPIPTTPFYLHQPCDVGGYRVPAGTWVVLSIWGLHHRPDLHSDPETFRPERFLEDPPARGTWLPFGTGPHGCVATQLALVQARELMHTLARRGSLEPASRRDEQVKHRSGSEIYPGQGCRVILHTRP
ncbi:cytochrome P450 [Streptomyces atroolivaceus]|uniref:cytochrome P450 n=1 Tax=Streptomyces atroolivaceus TaxID=66869 RepID=UPI0036348AD7